MKSSTLHRSNLTKERMSMLENVKFQGKYSPAAFYGDELNGAGQPGQSGQYIRITKTPELDVLYRSLGKNIFKKSISQGATSVSGKIKPKVLGVYLSIGAIGALVFILIVSLVVWISSIPTQTDVKPKKVKNKANLEVVAESKEPTPAKTQEKYVIKSGDTLDKIAYRFYGKYDVQKIEEIKKINNITNPEGLQIGQVLTIPLGK